MCWNKVSVPFALACGIVAPSTGWARQVRLDVSMAQSVMPADKKQTTFLKIGLTGFRLDGNDQRTPINIALGVGQIRVDVG